MYGKPEYAQGTPECEFNVLDSVDDEDEDMDGNDF